MKNQSALYNTKLIEILNSYKEKGFLFEPYSLSGIDKLIKLKILDKDDLERLEQKNTKLNEDYFSLIYFQFVNNRDQLAKLMPGLEKFYKKYYQYPLFILIDNFSKEVLYFNFQKNNKLVIVDSKGKDQTESFMDMDEVDDSDPILLFGEYDWFYFREKMTFALHDGGKALYTLLESEEEIEFVNALNKKPDPDGNFYLEGDSDKNYPYTKSELNENVKRLKEFSKILDSANNLFSVFDHYIDFQTLIDED
jgi:hypothetical protein